VPKAWLTIRDQTTEEVFDNRNEMYDWIATIEEKMDRKGLKKGEDYFIRHTPFGADDWERETWDEPGSLVDSGCEEDFE